MYDNYQEAIFETDECLSKGICSISPAFTSIQEVILLYIKELSFYLLRLKEYGISNTSIRETIIYALSNIITNAEYSQEQFHELISKLYDYIFQSKALYEKYCIEHDIEMEVSKSYFKYSKKFDLTDAIRKGEKYFLKKSNSLTHKQKDLYDIMFFLVKSITVKITELRRFGNDYDEAYFLLISMLDSIRPNEIADDEIKEYMLKAIKSYHEIVNEVLDAQIENYGKISTAEVSFSTEEGKAILVSGSDLKKLGNVLKATEGKDISVYTHGLDMFMAHSYPKLRSHPNLKGHYGSGMDSTIIDFATFPGAILMTKFTIQRIEYLFRGRLFTLDPIAPRGVVKIQEDDYEPLIKSALDAKGFTHATKKPPMKVGFDAKEIEGKINYVFEKIATGELKNIYIVGLINYPNIYKQYFDKFFNLLPKDSYVFSLNYQITKKNVFYPNSYYDYSLFYKIMEEISKRKPISEINMSVFLTKCDKQTIANLLYMRDAGVRHIYTCKCPPSFLNPALMETLKESFDIKEISDPKSDIEDTLK